MAEQEEKWRRARSEASERLERIEHERKQAEQQWERERKRADLAERQADNLAMENAKLKQQLSLKA